MVSQMTKINSLYERTPQLDRTDPLQAVRNLFYLPENIRYFDGNSLGALPLSVIDRMNTFLKQEWGADLIRGWVEDRWMDLPERIGTQLAPLLGALPEEVTVADSTSVNLYKLLHTAFHLIEKPGVILTDEGNFPTDLYILERVCQRYPQFDLHIVPSSRIEDYLQREPVRLVCLSHVDYRTGEAYDLEASTRIAHDNGAIVLYDLSHSTGIFPLKLHQWQVDFAVGCGYKFLNGGPGAPSFIYVHRTIIESNPHVEIPGWMGHADPFAFDHRYQPSPGIRRFLAGTPYVIPLIVLEEALKVYESLDLKTIYKKVHQMVCLFADFVECFDDKELERLTPTTYGKHGAQMSLKYPRAERLIQQLAHRGIIADFRPPDIMRFGLSPLYNRYEDIAYLADHLAELL